MDNLETPYEDEAEFIECTVCEKSIRGDTLFRIHLTTPGHLKKEDALVAAGRAVRQRNVPVFEDIVHYLDYMKLDEPIIGLNYLEEVPSNDPQAGPRYTCRLCHQTSDLSETVRHVIGRKHRQKYVELKRPDLVTWDKQSIITQGGKIIRARAEIIERQDGRGFPVLMTKNRIQGKLNITRVPQKQKQNRDRNFSQRLSQHAATSHIPPLMDFRNELFQKEKHRPGQPNAPPVHPDDSYRLNRDRQMHQQEDAVIHDHMEEDPRRANYSDSDMHRQAYMDPDYRGEHKEEYIDDRQRRAVLEPDDVPRYDSRAEVPLGQAQHDKYYSEETSPYRSPFPERDPLKEFYSEEIRRGQGRSAEYQPSKPVYPDSSNHRWSLDRGSERHDHMNRTGRQGSSEPEANRRSFSTSMERDQSREHVVHVRDYGHKTRDPLQGEADGNPGPSRTAQINSHRQMEATRSMPDIPEPFRRFLSRATNDEGRGKRKRKSRFSDATADEVETTKEMFSNEYGPPNPKFAVVRRPVSAPLRPEIHGVQRPNLYTESQSSHHTESYQSGDSEPAGVFDMLKHIEIDNAEEADFLKNKLCDLLKEFKAKKSDKTGQNIHSRAAISKEYSSLKRDTALPPRNQYETVLREDLDLRRTEDLYFQEDHRGRGWKQHEHIPDERLKEYQNPARGEPRQPNSNRSRYEEVFGQPDMSLMPRTTHPDEPTRYTERFQEPIPLRDYRPAAQTFLDTHSTAPPLHMERGPRMDRASRYSSNLDKITSTLLELVARK